MRKHFISIALAIALVPVILAPFACADSVAAQQSDAVCPRGLGVPELFGPVLGADLVGVLSKCTPSGQYFWLTFADDGPHLSVSFAGESTEEAVTCVQNHLLLLGLAVLVEDTGDASTSGTTN